MKEMIAMGKINLDSCNRGLNKVRGVGMPFNMLTGTFDFGDSYPAGGEDFDLKPYFPKGIVNVNVFPKSGYTFEYDETNKKIIAYSAADTEVTDATDLSALTGVSFVALGY